MNKKLRITFIIPFTNMTGGIAVVLEYYRQLTAMGHDVKIVYPLLTYWGFLHDRPRWKVIPAWVKASLINFVKFKRDIPLFSEDIPVTPVLNICDRHVPDADAVIATAWPTAYDVAKLSPQKGRKFYFVQGYEIWSGVKKTVEATYRLPLNIITIAPWLADLMKEKFGRNDVAEIHNGVRLDLFYPPAKKNFDDMSILMMAHDLELKGTVDGIEALMSVKERHPQVTINLFGKCPPPNAPFDFEYHRDPSYEKLLSLYQHAAIFISPSHYEGWHLPPMEAMACKCAVVATNVGCIPTLNNGKNLILAGIKNPASIADAVIKLLDNRELTEQIAEEGLKRVREQNWERSTQKFASVLHT